MDNKNKNNKRSGADNKGSGAKKFSRTTGESKKRTEKPLVQNPPPKPPKNK